MKSVITLALLGVVVATAACTAHKPYPDVRYKTCPFAGVEIIDQRECLAIDSIHNISPDIGQKVDMNKVDNRKTYIHRKAHYQCKFGGTNPHHHNGIVYHSSCYAK
ncbi:MAG: hypothetical protein H6922_03865 [Pseudomonadaceae bacterium]|nr:hypothetical protein [Pseudomonadaceae bacterium]